MAGRARSRRSNGHPDPGKERAEALDVREPSRSKLIRYRVLRDDNVARPYVMCSAGRSRLPALVDSGADGSAVPLEVVRRLNIAYDPNNVRIGFGAGGPFTEQQTDGDIVLESEIGAIVLTKPSINAALPFILLGRRDFFDGRRVCFDQRAQQLDVQRR